MLLTNDNDIRHSFNHQTFPAGINSSSFKLDFRQKQTTSTICVIYYLKPLIFPARNFISDRSTPHNKEILIGSFIGWFVCPKKRIKVAGVVACNSNIRSLQHNCCYIR